MPAPPAPAHHGRAREMQGRRRQRAPSAAHHRLRRRLLLLEDPSAFLSPRLLPIPVRGPALLSAHSSFFLANSHSCPSAAVQRPLQLPRLLLRGDLGASPSASGPVCSPTKCFPPSENFCPRVHLTRSPSQGVLLRETEDLPLRIHLPARGKAQVTATTCLETAALPPSWALYENGGLSSVKW